MQLRDKRERMCFLDACITSNVAAVATVPAVVLERAIFAGLWDLGYME